MPLRIPNSNGYIQSTIVPYNFQEFHFTPDMLTICRRRTERHAHLSILLFKSRGSLSITELFIDFPRGRLTGLSSCAATVTEYRANALLAFFKSKLVLSWTLAMTNAKDCRWKVFLGLMLWKQSQAKLLRYKFSQTLFALKWDSRILSQGRHNYYANANISWLNVTLCWHNSNAYDEFPKRLAVLTKITKELQCYVRATLVHFAYRKYLG